MSVQPSVASFFGKRKRLITDDAYKSKLLKTSHCGDNVTRTEVINCDIAESECSIPPPPAVEQKTRVNTTFEINNCDVTKSVKPGDASKTECKSKHKQLDIREALRKCQEKEPRESIVSPVKFQLMGSLSPVKKINQKINAKANGSTNVELTPKTNSAKNLDVRRASSSKSNPSVRNLDFREKNAYPTEDVIKSAKELVSKIKETQKKLTVDEPKKKELSLKEIKDKINRSSKLTELKNSINKINQHAEELIELEKRKLTGTQPKLSKFSSFDIEIPISPQKSSLRSPVKHQRSPYKPAYERFAGLVESAVSLPLPFGYQKLYELFCAADTICSMITNRGEMLTFNKLKPSVEEMTRKTFTHRHLGQIATVYPDAFTFHQEKLRNFGSTSKVDKYELVITPKIPKNQEIFKDGKGIKDDDVFGLAERRIMTPKFMKARKEIFYNSLLERTKDFHEEFLKTLEPPISINRNDLKRWHPNFMVDLVPDVNPQELPQPPNTERAATAREVLERAKDFLSSNARLHKALEAAASSGEKPKEVSPEIKEKVDARLKNPLKGVSKSLLEKVRAKQAAKALDAMRMTPEDEKEVLMYMRLPEMARIIRTAFINEQKGVIPMETLLEKVQFSCNRSLGLNEVDAHIRLLTTILPEWLSIVTLRNVNFLKIDRKVDAALIMAKLKKVVEDKKAGKEGRV